MRAATAAVIILVLLVSAFSERLELDHGVSHTQAAAVSVNDIGSDDGSRVKIASSAECHAGLSCIPAIMPGDEQGLEDVDFVV